MDRLYKILLILSIIFLLAIFPIFWLNSRAAEKKLEVDFLDIGQGDAELIKTPYGQNILIDGGPDNTVIKRLSENLSFWDKTIDLMILTHPHADHVTGLNEVIKRYNVKRILATGVNHTAPAYISWLKLIRDKHIPLIIVKRPQKINLAKDCWLDIIYPLTSFFNKTVNNLNNTSITARLVYKQTAFLFTGDAEEEEEESILSSGVDIFSQVLKVGHHGSNTSSKNNFLKAIQPQIAIISDGQNNKFGFPSPRVLKRLEVIGAKVYRTDEDGTIKIISDGEKIKKK